MRTAAADDVKCPLFALVAYAANAHPVTVAANLRELTPEERPDITCVIGSGIVGGTPDVLGPVLTGDGCPDEYCVGIAALHQRDAAGLRVAKAFRDPPDDWIDPITLVDGIRYPIVETGSKGRYVVSEPSRALLLTCEVLLRYLALLDGRPASTLSHYLTGAVLDLSPL